jgi:hypothetical protein
LKKHSAAAAQQRGSRKAWRRRIGCLVIFFLDTLAVALLSLVAVLASS